MRIPYLLIFSICFIFSGCCTTSSVKNLDGDTIPIPGKCEKLVDYQSRHLAVSGVEVPIPEAGSIKIGNVLWKKDKLQEAGEAAQLLDIKRYNACTLLGTRISMMNRKDALQHLDNYESSQDKIMQLALVIGSNNANAPKMLDKFIEAYFTEVDLTNLTGLAGGENSIIRNPIASILGAHEETKENKIVSKKNVIILKDNVKKVPNSDLFGDIN